MRKPLENPVSKRAFTLIELLIVIGIIAILASILAPVISKVKETALKLSAENDANQLVIAITTFRTEYGRLPLEDTAGKDPDPILTEAPFMKILLAEEDTGDDRSVLNRRGIIFFGGRLQSKPGGHGLDLEGNYHDPWGNLFEVFLDGNYDNRMTILEQEIRKTAGVRSMGPDEKFEVPEDKGKSDDIKTW